MIYVQAMLKKVDEKIITEFLSNRFTLKSEVKAKLPIDKNIAIKTHNLPISINEKTLGTVLPTRLDSDGNITKIDYNINGITTKFLDLIKNKSKFLKPGHKDRINVLDSSFKFYLLSTNTTKYILGISKLSDNVYRKIRFSLQGVVLANIVDRLKDNNVITREDGNTTYYISNGIVSHKTQLINLLSIKTIHNV